MEKLSTTGSDQTRTNIDRIAELFPQVVTETFGDDGSLTRGIDFDLLRQELSDAELVDGPRERFRLDWPGKRKAMLEANSPIDKTLRPVRADSVNFDTTQNLFIEGDNLEVLKLLQESYLGQVKLIYIDPPYNTGHDFIYDDDYSQTHQEYLERTGQIDEEGGRLVTNTESNGRFHSDWLSMMYPRLKLARNLLADDGIGLVSIDDTEVARLKILLEEVFGPANVVATLVWASNMKGRQISDGGPARTHEYILCFARNAAAIEQFRGSAAEFRRLMPDVYKGGAYTTKRDAIGSYVTKNELYNTNSRFNERTAPTMVFRIHYDPRTGDVKVSDIDDPVTFDGYLTAMPHANSRPGYQWHAWRWSRAKILAESENLEFDASGDTLRIWTKIRDIDGMTMKDLILGPSTLTGQADLRALGLERVFETPKPVSLLKVLVDVTTNDTDLVMDFFAGSSSTAEAVMRLNAEDGGRRRFLLIQVAEDSSPNSPAIDGGYATIAAIGRERIRRAGSKIVSQVAKLPGELDVGFRALRVASSGMSSVLRTPDETKQDLLAQLEQSIEPDRSPEDLLFQVILDWGLELSVPIDSFEVAGHRVLDADNGGILACFDDSVSPEVVHAMADRKPLRAVFRDSAFAGDAERINVDQIFTELSPRTDVKTI